MTKALSFLKRKQAGLLVIDMQDCLIPAIEHSCEVIQATAHMVKGAEALGLPIFVSEQNPQKLGSTTAGVRMAFSRQEIQPFTKMSFSCLGDENLRETIHRSGIKQWILAGLEAHICVLQTAKDLVQADYEVIVLNDAIMSRSIFNFSTAIAEMRDFGVRITCVETVLFELLGTASAEEFRTISKLIK